MSDVFISYARSDEDRAAQFQRAISNAGWTVWWDRDLLPGQRWNDVIETRLKASAAVVVLWSEHALQSDFVRDEADIARRMGKLVPVSIDGHKPPLGSLQNQVEDMRDWDGQDPNHPGLRRVLAGIRHKIGGGEGAPANWHVGSAEKSQEKSHGKSREETDEKSAFRKYRIAEVGAAIAAGALVAGYAAGVSYFRGDALPSGTERGNTSSSSSAVDGGKANADGTTSGSTTSGARPEKPKEKVLPPVVSPVVSPPPAVTPAAAAVPAAATSAAPAERGCASLIAATRKLPDVAENFFALGKCHYDEGRFNVAVGAFNTAISLNDNLPKYYEARGLAKWKNNLALEGITDLGFAIDLAPRDATYYETRGQIHLAIGATQKAIDDYGKATRLNKDSKRAWLGLAEAAEKHGAIELAAAARTQVEALP